ncbi:peptidase M14 [Flavobacteriaceae bacterium R38]|nr:peptidase M14 [Flavobacteriaceae bacterium R38]
MRRPLSANFLLIYLFFISFSYAQVTLENVIDSYQDFKEKSIKNRRVKHHELQPLINDYKSSSKFTITTVGKSIEGRKLSLISLGSGDTNVFLWSQMHGDESTATMAIFDLLNFFKSVSYSEIKEPILEKLKIHFLPMLNPDGAERFQRRNSLGIDINRDALRLQSPEAQTLKRVRDSLEANYGFNLHDQSKYYNTFQNAEAATISFLAPAYNYQKSINDIRSNAMKLIAHMNDVLKEYAPGHIGKYNDDFEPRAFGDNIQKWGTSTILIESGGFIEDEEKQFIRKLNFIAILSAFEAIANEKFKTISLKKYREIPNNDKKLFDLKLSGFKYSLLGKTYTLDLGINNYEEDIANNNDFYYRSSIEDQGDLSTYYGYLELDLEGYTYKKAAIYPKVIENLDALGALNFEELLRQGYGYVRVKDILKHLKNIPYPIQVISTSFKTSDKLQPGKNIPFFLTQNNRIRYAIINGAVIDLVTGFNTFKNGLIIR